MKYTIYTLAQKYMEQHEIISDNEREAIWLACIERARRILRLCDVGPITQYREFTNDKNDQK